MTLNPDTMIGGSEVDQLVEVLDRDPTVGIAVPVLSGVPVYKKHYSFSTLFFRSSLADKFSVTAKKNKVQTEAFDVVFFAGTGYVCRRAALPPGKVFFEDYFLFGEEYFLCKYVVDKNWTIRVIPSAKLIHFKGVTFKSDPARLAMAARLGSALSAYIRQQHWGRTRALLASLWLGLEYSCRSLIVICASLFSRRIQDDMDILLAQYKSYVIGALSGFFGGEHVLRKLNKRAEAFFNGGSTPTYPPASYDV
jgi:GT2 family glycosyltransferase